MKTWTVVAGVLTGLVILGLLGYIYLLNRKHEAELSKWRRTADQKYREGRNEAAQLLRTAVDQITDDKVKLAGMSEKELMVETMLALSGFGRRMDRMEDSLRAVSQFDGLLDAINGHAGLIAENGELLSQQVTQVQDAASAFRATVDGTNEAVYSLSDSTHNIEQLIPDITAQLTDLGSFSSSLAALQTRLDGVLLKINKTLKASADNPAATLSQMDTRIDAVYNQLQNLSEGLNLMAESLEGMQETLDAVNRRTSQPRPVSPLPTEP